MNVAQFFFKLFTTDLFLVMLLVQHSFGIHFDILYFFPSCQLTVSVRDNGSPSRAGTNTAVVTITVNRNTQAPRFVNAPYSSIITRLVQDNSALPGVSVVTTDGDTVVSHS